MIALLLKSRYVAFGAVLGLLAWLLAFGGHVRYEQSLTAFFPEGDPAVRDYQRAAAQFGNDNVVFLTYDDPNLLTAEGMERLGELARSVETEKIPAVVDVQSLDRMPLFWQIDDRLIDLVALPGFARRLAVNTVKASVASLSQENSPFTVGGALKTARGESLKALREQITTHPLLRDTLVSRKGTSSALVVRVKPMEEQDPKQTVADLRSAADAFAKKYGLGRPAVVGPPVLLADGFSAIERDGRRLAIAGMGLIGLVTLSVTQSLWWALVPILAGWVVWLAAEAAMSALGIRLSLSGGPLVAQIIVLTMPAASHLAIHFRDALRSTHDRWAAARETIGSVRAPVLWTAVTGAIGYGALLSSDVVPVFQFGGVLAACTLVASLLTLVISPIAMLPPFPMEWPVKPGSTSRLARVMNGLTARVVRHPAKIVLGTLLVVLPLSAGMFRLDYESNYINAFKPDTRVVQDYRFTEERLGGIGVVSVVMPAGETIDVGLVKQLRDLDQRVYGLRRGDAPAVSQVVSLATVLDPEGKLSALPEEKAEEAVKTKLELIQASPQGGLLRGFWSPRKEGDEKSGWTRLVIRIPEQQAAPQKEKTFEEALALVRSEQGSVKSRESYVTGLSYLLTRTTRGVIASSWVTFLWSISGILLMLTLAFRGPRLAALAVVPTLLSVGLVLGLTGWMGVKLDLATALVASVALGLSVDDTFHCLLQFRRHRAQHESFARSLAESYHVTGPGVILSSLAVAAGFAVLRFSEFLPFSNFGSMVGIATLGSSIGNLLLLPACLVLGHRLANRNLGIHKPPLVKASVDQPGP